MYSFFNSNQLAINIITPDNTVLFMYYTYISHLILYLDLYPSVIMLCFVLAWFDVSCLDVATIQMLKISKHERSYLEKISSILSYIEKF